MAAGAAARPLRDPGDWVTVDPGDWETISAPVSALKPPADARKFADSSQEMFNPSQPARFAKNLWEQINPLTMAEGLATALGSPIETAKGILAENQRLADEARAAAGKGDYATAARKGLSYLANALPGFGSTLDVAAEQAESGDIAGAAGKVAGLGGAVAAGPKTVKIAAGTPAAVAGVGRAAASKVRALPGAGIAKAGLKGVEAAVNLAIGRKLAAAKSAAEAAQALRGPTLPPVEGPRAIIGIVGEIPAEAARPAMRGAVLPDTPAVAADPLAPVSVAELARGIPPATRPPLVAPRRLRTMAVTPGEKPASRGAVLPSPAAQPAPAQPRPAGTSPGPPGVAELAGVAPRLLTDIELTPLAPTPRSKGQRPGQQTIGLSSAAFASASREIKAVDYARALHAGGVTPGEVLQMAPEHWQIAGDLVRSIKIDELVAQGIPRDLALSRVRALQPPSRATTELISKELERRHKQLRIPKKAAQ